MIEARVGRLLGAALHQAISDVLPQRLDFYEHWLHSEGLRDGSIGLAPLTAVLGFLRTEGASVYDAVADRSGTLAAEWFVDSMSPFQRRFIAGLPRPFRARAAVRVAKALAKNVYRPTKVAARVSRSAVRFGVAGSLFCAVREPQATPLCGFYATMAASTLTRLGVPASARVECCRAVDGRPCSVTIDLGSSSTADGPAMAA